ncbi:MAG: helix-turn-helix domain-containing protein [Methylobacterium sp.]|jgi:DNA-binding winged helix-turn-helix (wHTH) protein|nr:helix-turn-helix domain-containing protein [Methylobacterium sp.]MCA3652992.1 helix-turn-helix domain-containing protein [Methylobacterium sp.]
MSMLKYWNQDLRRRFPTHEAALDRIAELEELRSAPDSIALRVLGLTPVQMRIVSCIAARGHVAREHVILSVWGSNSSADPDNNLSTQLGALRRKLARSRVKIETVWGGEFRMDAGSIARWNEAVRRATGGER